MAKGRNNTQSKVVASAAVDTKSTLSDMSKMKDTDKVTVVSEKRAGKTIFGIGKAPIVFDTDGKAEVSVLEAKYFLTIPGFSIGGVADAGADTENSDGGKDGSDETSETTESVANAENADAGADTEK